MGREYDRFARYSGGYVWDRRVAADPRSIGNMAVSDRRVELIINQIDEFERVSAELLDGVVLSGCRF